MSKDFLSNAPLFTAETSSRQPLFIAVYWHRVSGRTGVTNSDWLNCSACPTEPISAFQTLGLQAAHACSAFVWALELLTLVFGLHSKVLSHWATPSHYVAVLVLVQNGASCNQEEGSRCGGKQDLSFTFFKTTGPSQTSLTDMARGRS